MKSDWLEGCAHFVRIAQTAVAGLAAIVLLNFNPDVIVGYFIDGPNGIWQIDEAMACEKEPQSQSSSYPGTSGLDDLRRITGGTPILARLCFKARMSKDGHMLIPVSEDGHTWTGWPKDSPEALRHANSMAAAFDPVADVDRQAAVIADEKSYQLWRSKILDTVGGALAIILALEAVWQLFARLARSLARRPKEAAVENA